MATKIRFRRDTAANWSSVNPILGDGEAGLERDTGKFKIGNGTSHWNDLVYSSGTQGIQGETGADGVSSYTYMAYASDASGTGFTTTFSISLDYIAIKTTTSPISSPAASDFTGLWKNYKGATGATGATGAAGTNGTNGTDGVGIPTGGTTGQTLTKIDNTDYNTHWSTSTGSGDMLKSTYDTDDDGIVDKAESVNDGINSATATDITDAVTKKHSHSNLTALNNVSNTNSGDETTSTIKTKLGITTLSGANTGDEDASSIKSKLGITTLSGSNTGDETTTTLGTKINGATEKVIPIDTDMIGAMDSAASNILKKLSWVNIKAVLKTYFDTIYNNYVLTKAAVEAVLTGVITSHSHTVSKSDVGLGNVTNDAQVKKAASSTDGKIPKWSGTTGDIIIDGYTVGTAANNLIQLDANAKLPAVDGSQLTNLPSGGSGGATVLSAIKTSNQSITSSTTLTNDNDLHLSFAASSAYIFEMQIVFNNPINTGFTYPSGSTMNYTLITADTFYLNAKYVAVSSSLFAIQSSQNSFSPFTSPGTMHLRGIIITGSTAGTLQFQWAQPSSSSTAAVMLAGSFIFANKL